MALTTESIKAFDDRYKELFAAAQGATSSTLASSRTNLQNHLDTWNAAVQEAVRRSQADITKVSEKAATLAESQQTLQDLLAKQGTRDEQASSVNPKVTQSPYVNILGLRRNFRQNTRVGLIVASVAFGVLALGALGYYITRSISEKTAMNPSALLQGQVGGRRR